LAERFSDIRFFIAKKDREAVAENLRAVLKKEKSLSRTLARKVFRNFGLYLVDFFRIHRLDKEYVKRKVRIEGLENVEKVLKEDRGVVLLTGHIGNWEMGGVVVAIMGYDISAVALNHRHQNINQFFIRQREKKGLKVITMNAVMKRCVSALLKKGMLALLGDRDFTNSGIMLDFFGIPTSIPRGPAFLSLRTNCPVVPVFFIREGRYNYTFIFDKPIEVERISGVEENEIVRQATLKFTQILEKYIKKYPEQWLVFRKFWETPVDAFVL